MPIDLDPSPALQRRKVGDLLAPAFDLKLKSTLVAAIKKEGAPPAIIALRVGGVEELIANPDSVVFPMDACRHLKAIGLSGVAELSKKAQVADVVGVTDCDTAKGVTLFIDLARDGKIWDKEPAVTPAIR